MKLIFSDILNKINTKQKSKINATTFVGRKDKTTKTKVVKEKKTKINIEINNTTGKYFFTPTPSKKGP